MTAEDRPIERRVGEALSSTDATVAVAESCTGGLIGSLLTDVPGASEYFMQGFIAYAYDTHRTLLGVDRETLDAHGAVSAESAGEMARTARDRADSTWGLAATGVLGPGGGSPEKPAGTTFIAVSYAGEWESRTSETTVEQYTLDGDRQELKEAVARTALDALYEAIAARQ
jgi:nicotinamide-nucleotide amidase